MKSVKEQVIEEIVFSMTGELDKNGLNKLLYNASKILKDMNVSAKENSLVPTQEHYTGNTIIRTFTDCKRVNGCQETTLKRYGEVLKRYAAFIGDENLLTATTNDIRCFLGECYKTMGTTAVDGFRLVISSFYSWLVQDEIIPKNPCAKIPRIKDEKKIRSVMTQREVVRLKDYCETPRERVFIDLLDSCGLRCMEITTLKISDIDFNRRVAKIYGKGKKWREVVLSDECIEHLDRYLMERRKKNDMNDYVIARERRNAKNWNTPLSTNGIADIMRKIGKRAKVNGVHIHALRRKFATDLNRRGMSVFSIQKLMGHASISTTQIYITDNFDNIVNEYNRCKN